MAVWPARRETGTVEHAEPVLASPTSVRVRTLEVGVCGTDSEICSLFHGLPPEGCDYLIPGHEALGEVVEVGPGVSGLAPGDLVVPSVRRPCSHAGCPACRAGEQDFCTSGDFTERGIRRAHGFLTEQVAEEERFLYRVPPGLRAVGVLTEPLTIAEKALRQFLAVQRRLPWARHADDAALTADRRAVVLGAGPVGLLGCMLLRHHGFRVWVYSRESARDPRAGLVRSLGAAYLSAGDAPFADLAAEVGGSGGIDFVYEAAGDSALVFEVLRHLGRNGVMVLAGVPVGHPRLEVPADDLMHHIVVENLALLGTVNASGADFEAAIGDLERFAARWPGAVRGLVTGRFPMDDFFRCVAERGGIKKVIVFDSLPGPRPAR